MGDLEDLANAARHGSNYVSPSRVAPPELSHAKVWIVDDGGVRSGPFSQYDLHTRLAARRVSTSAIVWQHGWARWSPILNHFTLPPPPPVVRRAKPKSAWPVVGIVLGGLLVLGMLGNLISPRPHSPAPAAPAANPSGITSRAERLRDGLVLLQSRGLIRQIGWQAGELTVEPSVWEEIDRDDKVAVVNDFRQYFREIGDPRSVFVFGPNRELLAEGSDTTIKLHAPRGQK